MGESMGMGAVEGEEEGDDDGVDDCLDGIWALLRLLADDIAELSLTVPITNSMAFLFTVLGDWYVDGKIISRSKSTVHAARRF